LKNNVFVLGCLLLDFFNSPTGEFTQPLAFPTN
jgi:hypothetical protein